VVEREKDARSELIKGKSVVKEIDIKRSSGKGK